MNNNNFSYFPFTPISNSFIEKYIYSTNPIFITLYIFFLKSTLSNKSIFLSNVSKNFNILETDIIKCLEFWKNEGVIGFQLLNGNLSITFFNDDLKSKVKVINKNDITYSDEQILDYSKQQEIKQLFNIVENKFAKTLSFDERKSIIEIFDGYGLNSKVFAILITYCKDKNKTNFNYIKKVAIDWVENGLDTPEKVDSYIKMFENDFKTIMKTFGLSGEPAPVQVDIMKKWVMEFKLPLEVIILACERSIIKTGKPTFEYANKILSDWAQNNINTIEKVKKLDYDFKQSNSFKSTKIKNENKSNNLSQVKNKFVNFKQPKIDFDKLRELEIKSLKGEI